MSERVQRNISRKFIGEVGSRAVSFAFNLALAHGLGKEAYGRYSYAYAFAGVLAMCGELGLNTVLTREVAKDRAAAPKFLAAFAPLRFVAVLGVAVVTILAAQQSATPDRFWEITLMAGFMAANTLLDYNTAILNAFERMKEEAAMRVATRITVSAFGIGAILLHQPLVHVIGAVAAANLMTVGLASELRSRLKLAFPAEWDGAFVWRTLVAAIPVAAAWFGIVLYFYMDALVLKALGMSDGDIGQYGAASKILEAAQGIPLVVVGGIFPIVAELSQKDGPSAAAPYFSNVARLCLVLGAPLAAIGAILSVPVARLLYGADFTLTGPALAILALSAPLFFSNLIAIYLLLAMGRRWEAASFRGAACLLKLGLLVIAAPAVGIVGAAAAMFVTDLVLFVLLLAYRLLQKLSHDGELVLTLQVALVTLLAGGAYWLVISRGIALQLLVVTAVYGLSFGLLFRAHSPRSFLGLQ